MSSGMPRLRRNARHVIHAVALPQKQNIKLLQQKEGFAGRDNSQSFDLISEPRLSILKEQAIQSGLIWLIYPSNYFMRSIKYVYRI